MALLLSIVPPGHAGVFAIIACGLPHCVGILLSSRWPPAIARVSQVSSPTSRPLPRWRMCRCSCHHCDGIVIIVAMVCLPLNGRHCQPRADVVATIVQAQPPSSRWRLCQRYYPKGVVAIIALALPPVALALTPNIALASLPSSCNHHAVVFVTLALAVSPSLC